MEPPHFGRYRTLSRLGAGAAGEVWRARDEMLARDVAIKVVPRVGRNAQLSLDRFFQEARAVAALSHPGVIRVFDMGEQDGTPFLVMELAPGGSLRDRLADHRPLPVSEACALGIQIAQALAAAHARGIVHRDVKPANVLRDDDHGWRLADFGVAHVPDSTLTFDGQFLGSPAYAAPESLSRGEFGPASDVWGLGATLFEAVTGAPPWGDRDYAQILAALDGEPPRVADLAPTIPPAIATAIDRALSRHPDDRPTAQGLAAALATGLTTAHVSIPPPPAFATGTAPPATAATTVQTARSSRTSTLIAIAASAILLVGLIAATAGRDNKDAAPPAAAPAPRPTPAAAAPGITPVRVQPRDEHHARAWRKIDDKLRKGELDKAADELDKLLSRYPDDADAARLLAQVEAELDRLGDDRGGPPPHARGKGKRDD